MVNLSDVFFKNLDAYRSGEHLIIDQGGQGSSKTYSILQLIYMVARKEKKRVTIASYALPHLKAGAMHDFDTIIESFGDSPYSMKNITESTYYPNHSVIEFLGIEGNVAKAHGPRRDILFINECNRKITYELFDQLSTRTQGTVFLDFNPDQEFWLHEKVIPNFKHTLIKSNYLDNPWLPGRELNNILMKKDKPGFENWWKVYGLGELGKLEGAILSNWRYGEFDNSLPISYGLDFGFSDPDAMVKIALDHKRKIMYWDEKIYKEGNSFEELKQMIAFHCNRNNLITADAADARMISQLRSYFNIKPVNKKKWTVAEALKMMQDYEHVITPASYNLGKELNNYIWNDKKAGIPIDAYNHCFTGETLITTILGGMKIKDLQAGDYVETSTGFNKVYKFYNNGKKQVNKYSIQFDTFSLSLCCTNEHLIKTTQGWKHISELTSGMKIFLNKNLTEKFTDFIPEKNISQEEISECTRQSGNSSLKEYLKDIAFTTRTAIRGIMTLKILRLKKKTNINLSTESKGFRKIKNGLINFMTPEYLKQKSGIDQMKESNGIESMGKNHGTTGNIKSTPAKIAERNLNQDIPASLNTVIITVKQVLCESEGEQQVYDLSIENEYEYFANGILVHNCIDAGRYRFMESVTKAGAQIWHT